MYYRQKHFEEFQAQGKWMVAEGHHHPDCLGISESFCFFSCLLMEQGSGLSSQMTEATGLLQAFRCCPCTQDQIQPAHPGCKALQDLISHHLCNQFSHYPPSFSVAPLQPHWPFRSWNKIKFWSTSGLLHSLFPLPGILFPISVHSCLLVSV